MHWTQTVLHEKGYILLRNILTDEEIQKGTSCIDTDTQTVHYTKMQHFIRNVMLHKATDALNLSSPLDYVKYRVSDNNNSADAAGFHRDVIYQGSSTKIEMPFFTCLTYFDDTVLEVIPGSHVRNYSLCEIPTLLMNKTIINIHPGDILLFYSSLLHRGIFTQTKGHRRLIQVFEVFSDYKAPPRVLHIRGNETYSNWMIEASKRNGLLVQLINLFGFLNAATGYGRCRITPSDHVYLSSEGLRGRINIEPETWQPINKYIHNENIHTLDLPDCYYYLYKYCMFNRQFVMYILYIAVLCTILLMAIKVKYRPQ